MFPGFLKHLRNKEKFSGNQETFWGNLDTILRNRDTFLGNRNTFKETGSDPFLEFSVISKIELHILFLFSLGFLCSLKNSHYTSDTPHRLLSILFKNNCIFTCMKIQGITFKTRSKYYV